MNITALIKHLKAADELLEIYGHCEKVSSKQTGLLPFIAVGLTALRPDVIKRVAPQLADKNGKHGWASVSQEDTQKYMSTFTKHLEEVECWTRHYLGEYAGFTNRRGILIQRIKELEKLR